MSKRNPTKHASDFVSALCWFLSKPLGMAIAAIAAYGMHDPTVMDTDTLYKLWVHHQGC